MQCSDASCLFLMTYLPLFLISMTTKNNLLDRIDNCFNLFLSWIPFRFDALILCCFGVSLTKNTIISGGSQNELTLLFLSVFKRNCCDNDKFSPVSKHIICCFLFRYKLLCVCVINNYDLRHFRHSFM